LINYGYVAFLIIFDKSGTGTQVTSDSFDHRHARCIPELVEKVVTAVERKTTIFMRQFLLVISTSRGKPLCRLSGDRLDEMKTNNLKTLETLGKLQWYTITDGSRRWMIRPVFRWTNNVTVQVMYTVHLGPHMYFELKERYAQPNFELF
jgi:hypothetical protein